MPFPEVKRVIYKKNPLDKVICQLRFPPILKIDTEIPAVFQERIRQQFPNLLESAEWNIEVPQAIKGQIPSDLARQMLQSAGIKNYQFSSEDGQWQLNLTRTFIALTANKYQRWEQFKDKLLGPLAALNDIYAPSFFSRIGLRYVDVIKRSALNLDGVNWSELLQPYVLGVLSTPEVSRNVQAFQSNYEIRLSDEQSMVRLIAQLVQPIDSSEICFMIDSDFFTAEKTISDDVMSKLNYLHARSSRLIQWCITERLHQAMEPQEL